MTNPSFIYFIFILYTYLFFLPPCTGWFRPRQGLIPLDKAINKTSAQARADSVCLYLAPSNYFYHVLFTYHYVFLCLRSLPYIIYEYIIHNHARTKINLHEYIFMLIMIFSFILYKNFVPARSCAIEIYS